MTGLLYLISVVVWSAWGVVLVLKDDAARTEQKRNEWEDRARKRKLKRLGW